MPRLEDSRTLAAGWSVLPQTSRPRRGSRCFCRQHSVRALCPPQARPAQPVAGTCEGMHRVYQEGCGTSTPLGSGEDPGIPNDPGPEPADPRFFIMSHIIFASASPTLPRAWKGWSAACSTAPATKIQRVPPSTGNLVSSQLTSIGRQYRPTTTGISGRPTRIRADGPARSTPSSSCCSRPGRYSPAAGPLSTTRPCPIRPLRGKSGSGRGTLGATAKRPRTWNHTRPQRSPGPGAGVDGAAMRCSGIEEWRR